ncbi:hypothetical protein Caci_4278 [Catenulispora acidiphila DSM 44928]|uniref:Uncharacterized protein n=1 Tax=Catenulispora acidiphila (strain DSM 44928 / JCM 14897 / NBRC 102108 / NRRL B-24433 / ID139908) TaxID=479433 RepID=C7QJQ4_CATAD|nr:hypothetical protein [Catenulispora acidiphila]ACU73142.1 hypothetical protein Caci_4278 [Catenulispora acidiphila DSM 44928]
MGFDSAVPYPGVTGSRPQVRVDLLLAGIAAAVGAAIVVAAAVVPVVTLQSPPAIATASAGYTATPTPSSPPVMKAQPRVTLLAHDGFAALGLAAIPLVVALGVGLLLWYAGPRGSRPATSTAWVLAVVLTAAAVVGFVTILIGVVAIPVGVLLILACTQITSRGSGSPASRPIA